MKHRRIRVALLLTLLAAATTATAEGGTADGGNAVSPSPAAGPGLPGTPGGGTPAAPATGDPSPVVIVVPTFFATDPLLNDGCWARLYDKKDFGGVMLTLVGPVDIPNNRAGFITGFEMGRNFDSLMTGARAALTVWDKPDFKNRSTTFGPGESIPDLNTRMGDFEEIKSLHLTCSP